MDKRVKTHKIVKLPGMPYGFGLGSRMPYTMPPLCVACGAPASPEYTLTAEGESEGQSVRVRFPICDMCHETLAAAGCPTGEYLTAPALVPEEIRDRYREIRDSVQMTLGEEYTSFEFTNEAFGQAFEELHQKELGWLRKYSREREAGVRHAV